jgi:hypothetical protein
MKLLGGGDTFGRGGMTHSLCVTTPAGETATASWTTDVALGASVTGPGLETDIGDDIAMDSH